MSIKHCDKNFFVNHILKNQSVDKCPQGGASFDSSEYLAVLPGFVDVHVHLREPGFSYKETIVSGSRACAHGGYTTVCSMPNLNPVPDSVPHIQQQLDRIASESVIHIAPYGSITVDQKGEVLSDMEELSPFIIAFSDDGRGVQSESMMESAMLRAKALNKMIVAHCEDNSLLNGGYIHKGKYALEHHHQGISSESEWKQIERDLMLAKKTGCAYHVCHISTKESVELIRKAKKEGVDVTCETAPHYLLLDDSMLQEDGRFKMNPPLRDLTDREALIQGIQDGTIDMIATDHAPHSLEEKSKGLKDSLMGVVGIETAFPLLYTYLVKTNTISLEKLMALIHDNPCKRFHIKESEKDFTVFDLQKEYIINPETFLSKGRSTPFAGWKVNGECLLTVCDGKIAYLNDSYKE